PLGAFLETDRPDFISVVRHLALRLRMPRRQSDNDLAKGAGEKTPLKVKGKFWRLPHLGFGAALVRFPRSGATFVYSMPALGAPSGARHISRYSLRQRRDSILKQISERKRARRAILTGYPAVLGSLAAARQDGTNN